MCYKSTVSMQRQPMPHMQILPLARSIRELPRIFEKQYHKTFIWRIITRKVISNFTLRRKFLKELARVCNEKSLEKILGLMRGTAL